MRLACLLLFSTVCVASNVLFHYKGDALPSIGEKGDFNYLSAGGFVANDGNLEIWNEALHVVSIPFKSFHYSLLDNPKYQLFTNQRFAIKDKLTAKMTAHIMTSGVDKHPFGDQVYSPHSDPRLAAGTMVAKDNDNGIVYSFVMSEGYIFAVVQSLLVTPGGPSDAPRAAYAIPLLAISPMGVHNIQIHFDKTAETISWVVNGYQYFQMKSSELLPAEHKVLKWGPDAKFRFPNRISVGFGTLSALEYYPPQYPPDYPPNGQNVGIALVKLAAPMQFMDPKNDGPAEYVLDHSDQAHQVWGQGAMLDVQDLIVEA